MCLGNHKKFGATEEQAGSGKKWGPKSDRNRIPESFKCFVVELRVYPQRAMKLREQGGSKKRLSSNLIMSFLAFEL